MAQEGSIRKSKSSAPNEDITPTRMRKIMGLRYGKILLSLTIVCLMIFRTVSASAYVIEDPRKESIGDADGFAESLAHRDPVFVYNMLSKLRKSILKPLVNTKRGLDFGLGRGFSGTQAAKHFMGLAAAKYSGGPGKRKRTQYSDDPIY